MKITIKETRKLLKELKQKYPEKECSVEIIFNSWADEHLTAYVSNMHTICSTKHYYSADEIRKEYGL